MLFLFFAVKISLGVKSFSPKVFEVCVARNLNSKMNSYDKFLPHPGRNNNIDAGTSPIVASFE